MGLTKNCRANWPQLFFESKNELCKIVGVLWLTGAQKKSSGLNRVHWVSIGLTGHRGSSKIAVAHWRSSYKGSTHY